MSFYMGGGRREEWGGLGMGEEGGRIGVEREEGGREGWEWGGGRRSSLIFGHGNFFGTVGSGFGEMRIRNSDLSAESAR